MIVYVDVALLGEQEIDMRKILELYRFRIEFNCERIGKS